MRIGRKLIHLESVDSTNNYVAKMLKGEGLPSGTVILADEQYSGKGQRGAEWLSTAGFNLTFSVYLDDVNLSVDRQFKITQLISLGIHSFLIKHGIESKIKWPNDAYVNKKKIGGILIENHISGKMITSTIIGVGLNVNQREFGELIATSMSMETEESFNLNELYFSLIHSLDSIWNELINDESLLDKIYTEQLYQFDQPCSYTDDVGDFIGEICGVSQHGKLLIKRNNRVSEYSMKEVKFN